MSTICVRKLVKRFELSLNFGTLFHDTYYLPYNDHIYHHFCNMVSGLGVRVPRHISTNNWYCKNEPIAWYSSLTKPWEHTIPMFLETKLPMPFWHFEKISELMYDVHDNVVPENILHMFQKVTNTKKYRARSTFYFFRFLSVAHGNFSLTKLSMRNIQEPKKKIRKSV